MSAAAQALGWSGVHLLWQGAAIAAAVELALALGGRRSPSARSAMALAGLLLMAAAPWGTAALLLRQAASPVGGTGLIAGSVGAPAAVAQRVAAAGGGTAWLDAGDIVIPVLLGAWGTGVVVLLVRLAGGVWLLGRARRRGAAPAPAEVVGRAGALASRMGVGRRFDVVVSARVAAPMVAGWRRPTVVLPAELVDALEPAELDAILLHELAHVRRGDYPANLLQCALEAFVFFHPAAWWLSRRARAEREQACDRLVVRLAGSPLRYARALLRIEELGGGRPRLALGAAGGSLLERVRVLVGEAPDRRLPRIGAAAAALVLLAALSATGPILLPASARAVRWAEAPLREAERTLITAYDPAGRFTVAVERGRVAEVVLAGVPLAPGRVVQAGDSVRVLDEVGRAVLALTLDPGGIRWTPRTAVD